jgi:1-acyl-sn-glycerol-3-phosphate acyltransferase
VASAFFWFWVGAGLLAWTLCPVLILAYRDEARRWRVCQRIVRGAFRLFHAYMEVLTLVELRVIGTRTRPPGPLVIVANHPTLVDVTAILSTYDDVCCVVRETFMKNVFVGRLLRTCGHVAASEAEGLAGAGAVEAIRRRLDAGMAVLFFPEGTRSPPRGLRPFRRGAFEIATRSHTPIWPLLMTCDPPALSKGLPIWKHPERIARQCIEPREPMAPPSDGRSGCRDAEAFFRACLPHLGPPPVADASRDGYPAHAAAP